MEIPETRQAEALQEVAGLGGRRTAALAEVRHITEELRGAAIKAARLGAPRTRINELAQVSPSTLYGWLEAAGLDVQKRRPKGGGSDA